MEISVELAFLIMLPFPFRQATAIGVRGVKTTCLHISIFVLVGRPLARTRVLVSAAAREHVTFFAIAYLVVSDSRIVSLLRCFASKELFVERPGKQLSDIITNHGKLVHSDDNRDAKPLKELSDLL